VIRFGVFIQKKSIGTYYYNDMQGKYLTSDEQLIFFRDIPFDVVGNDRIKFFSTVGESDASAYKVFRLPKI